MSSFPSSISLVLWTTACMAFANASGRAPAQPGHSWTARDLPSSLLIQTSPDVVDALELTTSQVTRLRREAYEARRHMIGLRARVEQARLDLEYFMEQDNVDETKAFRLVDEVKRLETDMDKLRISVTLSQNRILTPEQRERFRRFHLQRRADMIPPWASGPGAEARRFREQNRHLPDAHPEDAPPHPGTPPHDFGGPPPRDEGTRGDGTLSPEWREALRRMRSHYHGEHRDF